MSLAERKSRLFLVGKSPNKSTSEVQRVIERLLTPIKDFVHTVTYDNGKEFSYHAEVSATLNAQGFFAHPYHSWERGLNENLNGLLRQDFPKGASLASVTQDEIIAAMCRLNWRPRKCLGFKTPTRLFAKTPTSKYWGLHFELEITRHKNPSVGWNIYSGMVETKCKPVPHLNYLRQMQFKLKG